MTSLDIDGDGTIGALTDGILIVRYLFGLTGDPLIENAVGEGAGRSNADDIIAYLDGERDRFLDVDGDGTEGALTDGILIVRFLFGLRGEPLIEGAISNDATRLTAAEIEAFLEPFNTTMPMLIPGTLAFSESTYSVDETGVNAIITVTRTGGSDGAVSVNYTTSDGTATAGTDYTTASGVLDFADGETSKTFAIPIIDDPSVEGNETVNLSLSNPTGGASLGTDSATLTIVDNDPAGTPFNIEFDYRFDSTGFFDNAARTALEATADIWESFIRDEFTNVPAGIEFTVDNPTTGTEELVVLNAEIDDLLIFVGARSLSGTTLGFAGPDGFDASGTILSNRISGSDFEPWAGGLTFNSEANWFFDSTPDTDGDIPVGQSDFISTALHEIGHILGIGTADIFRNIGAGAAFNGVNALTVNGGSPIPLTSDLEHVQEGFFNDTVLMDPFSLVGTRTLPSQVDLALLADIGYEIPGFTQQGETPPIATVGDDLIFGTIVADRIDGLSGNDQIQGNSGDDTLIGGAGNDSLFGGAGIDTFVFGASNGQDIINDFVVANEVIQVASGLGFATGQDVFEAITLAGEVTGGGRFAVVTLSPRNTITILADVDVTAANFAIV